MAPKGRGRKKADDQSEVNVDAGIKAKKGGRPKKEESNDVEDVLNGEAPKSVALEEEQTSVVSSSDGFPDDKVGSKRRQKLVKTNSKEEYSKVEENSKAKRGRRGKIENGNLDNVDATEIKEDLETETGGEVKKENSKAKRGRKARIENGDLDNAIEVKEDLEAETGGDVKKENSKAKRGRKGKIENVDLDNATEVKEDLEIETDAEIKKEDSKAKRGRKGKLENDNLDNATEVKENLETETDAEVKELPTRSRRKEKAEVEPTNSKEKENKLKAKTSRKAAQGQMKEDSVEKETSGKGAGRKRKNVDKEVESESAKLVNDETFLVGENRQLRVAIKRNHNLDEMAKKEMSDDTEVKSAKGSSKSKGKRVAQDTAEDSKAAKKVKEDTSKSKSSAKKEQIPDVTALDFTNDSKSSSGNPWNLKIATWNVNGVRAWLEKNGMTYLHHEEPDILAIQETKCSQDKLPPDVNVDGYECYWLSGDKDGYSGVGLLSKKKPIRVDYGIGIENHDKEGRVITAEYDEFYLVAAYVPNSGRGLVRLGYRQEWDKDFRAYLKKLDEMKPVVLCGDLNVAHEEIDLANPKTNKKNAGFTKEERDNFSTLLSEGFVDSFRHLYPKETGAYTFWTYMMNARAKNVGWRLDYFVISKRFVDNLCDSVIRKDVRGSDHCPIALFLHV